MVQWLGAAQAENKPLSRASREFWCLRLGTTHHVVTCRMQPEAGFSSDSVILTEWKKQGVSVSVMIDRPEVASV